LFVSHQLPEHSAIESEKVSGMKTSQLPPP
jgi:hypothetical protein